MVLCITWKSSFISTQLLILNLVDWFGVLSNKFIIFWYSIFILLYQSQIIINVLPFFIHLSLGTSWLYSFLTVSELFCCKRFETFVILSVILLLYQITSCFCCFLNCSFRSSCKCICSRFFSMIKTFLAVFTV